MKKDIFKIPTLILALLFIGKFTTAQKINYSEPDRDDIHSVNFDIIGKLDGHILVYKNVRTNYLVTVYDDEMKLVKNNKMDFLPERIINSDIIAYKDFFYFIYQYQKKNIVYCMAAKINGEGKITGKPIQLDTTTIPFFATNKIYNLIFSENKQRIAVYKINTKDQTHYPLTTSLFDTSLTMLSRTTVQIGMPGENDFLTQFAIDDEGSVIFVRANSFSQSGNIEDMALLAYNPAADSIETYPIDLRKVYLDDIRLQVDNVNNQYLITSFFSKQKRGNIDGLYCCLWNKGNKTITATTTTEFNDELRGLAKKDGSAKTAFNDYYLQNILMRKDGGFAIATESAYSYGTNNSSSTNRWDNPYYSSPYNSSSNYYLLSSSLPYYYPWYSNGTNPYLLQTSRFFADNIAMLSFDSAANMQWSSVVPKSQYDDNSDEYIGYGSFKTSSSLNFLYNQLERRNLLLNMQSIDSKGLVIRSPTFKSLDKGYNFMPKYAKQVSKNEVLIPCEYRNYLCFAKIVF